MAKKSRSRTPQVPKVTVAPASPDGPNRKIRKEEARRQREALQRRAARRRFYRWGVVALIVVAALGTGTALVIANNGKGSGTGASPTPACCRTCRRGRLPGPKASPG